MPLKTAGLFAIMALSGCALPSEVTKVTNLSGSPLRIDYVLKDKGVTQTTHIDAGEAKQIAGVLANYDSVEFRDGNKNVIFRDSDPDWRDTRCIGECGFVWYGDGRVAITA